MQWSDGGGEKGDVEVSGEGCLARFIIAEERGRRRAREREKNMVHIFL